MNLRQHRTLSPATGEKIPRRRHSGTVSPLDNLRADTQRELRALLQSDRTYREIRAWLKGFGCETSAASLCRWRASQLNASAAKGTAHPVEILVGKWVVSAAEDGADGLQINVRPTPQK